MNPEIEKLIKLAIADGEITEKERAVIIRKAEKLGEDFDEVELILDGEFALLKKEQRSDNKIQIKSNKHGEFVKCPSCGASVTSFSTQCKDCGYEYQGIEVNKSAKQLYVALENAENEERNRPKIKRSFWEGGEGANFHYMETAIANRKIAIISSFPIPNSKGDILEFLSISVSNSEIFTVKQMFNGYERNKHNALAIAWLNKSKDIIIKARFSMKDDKKTLEEIENYAKQLGIK
jgi:predicted RNA-binding Zn-ribbon protein involved in translation (DUF1610 family)